jgi:hypothetical protein
VDRFYGDVTEGTPDERMVRVRAVLFGQLPCCSPGMATSSSDGFVGRPYFLLVDQLRLDGRRAADVLAQPPAELLGPSPGFLADEHALPAGHQFGVKADAACGDLPRWFMLLPDVPANPGRLALVFANERDLRLLSSIGLGEPAHALSRGWCR